MGEKMLACRKMSAVADGEFGCWRACEGFAARFFDFVDAGEEGALVHFGDEELNCRGVAAGFGFDRAVWVVAHPASEAKLLGLFVDEAAKADALNPAANDEPDSEKTFTGHAGQALVMARAASS